MFWAAPLLESSRFCGPQHARRAAFMGGCGARDDGAAALEL